MITALDKQPEQPIKSTLMFSEEDRKFAKEVLTGLAYHLGFETKIFHGRVAIKLQLMFGPNPSLQHLRNNPMKLGHLMLALCKDLGTSDSVSNNPCFRVYLRKLACEHHPYYREHIDSIIPLL